MGWDGAGGYTRQHNFSADASAGIKILALRMDQELDDIASAIPIALAKNGQNVPTGNLPMGGFRHINVAAAVSVNNYMRAREFVENVPIFMQDVETSADRISVSAQYFTSVSANQAPGDGTKIIVRAKSNKSSAVLYLNGHSANVHYTDGGRIASAMTSGGIYEFIYSSVDTAWKVKNPDVIDSAIKYVLTSAEITAGVTPSNFRYPAGWVERYGADPTGVSDSTTALNAALSVNQTVYLGGVSPGTYLAGGLTQSHNFQQILSLGRAHLMKNANGTLLDSSGDDVLIRGVDFRDDGSSYTGKGLVMSGDRARAEYCGGYLIESTCLEMTGAAPQVIGTCNIYQTRTAAGYDIVIGVSGTATLYARVQSVYTSQSGGGIRFVDCGSNSVVGSQFGKLFVDAGTSPVGVNGGAYTGNRILGNVTIEISNSDFAANTFGAITITLAAGTSGHHFGASNTYDSACTITDNSTGATIIDTRESIPTTYTPTWTGAISNPAIGDGTLTGRYMKLGKHVHVWIRMLAGSTTTFGSGAWFFSVPFTPATFGTQVGSMRILDSGTAFRTGAAVTLADGTARVQGTADSDTANIDSGRPMTWASGDELFLVITYLTN